LEDRQIVNAISILIAIGTKLQFQNLAVHRQRFHQQVEVIALIGE